MYLKSSPDYTKFPPNARKMIKLSYWQQINIQKSKQNNFMKASANIIVTPNLTNIIIMVAILLLLLLQLKRGYDQCIYPNTNLQVTSFLAIDDYRKVAALPLLSTPAIHRHYSSSPGPIFLNPGHE
jgi:hypothetical protein